MSNDNRRKNGFDRDAIDWARDMELPDERALKKLNPRACRTGTVKSVLLALSFRVHQRDDGQHVTWVGAKRLAKDTGYNERTVRASIDVLGKLGLLKREESDEHETDMIHLHVGAAPGTMPAPATGHTARTPQGTMPAPPPGINTSKTKNSSSSPENEGPVVVVTTTTTDGETSEKNGKEQTLPKSEEKSAALWPGPPLNEVQQDKLEQIAAELEAEGFEPVAGIKLLLKRWPQIRARVLSKSGNGYTLPEHPRPGNVLAHMPYVIKEITPTDDFGWKALPKAEWPAEIAKMLADQSAEPSESAEYVV